MVECFVANENVTGSSPVSCSKMDCFISDRTYSSHDEVALIADLFLDIDKSFRMPTANILTNFQLVKKSVHPVSLGLVQQNKISYYSVKVEERFDSAVRQCSDLV